MSRVLYIDDEPDILELAEIYFTDHKIDIVTAVSAREALELYKKEPFKVIISDARMPGIMGVELYNELVEKHRFNGKFILVSGHYENDDTKNLPQGIDRVLTKPIDFDLLINQVQQYLES